jgi:hypothetical protein
LFIWLRWKKIDSLVMFDTPRWLNEAFRLSRGEMPYRDFSWQYPPISIFLVGWCLRWFGVSFTVVQVLVNVLSLAVVLLCHVVTRMLLPRSLHLVTTGLFVVVGATNVTKYSLFSMLVYTPAILTGTIGLLMMMIGMLRLLQGDGLRWGNGSLIAVGFWIAALSKPESGLAAVTALVAVALLDREVHFAGRDVRSWLGPYLLLFAAAGGLTALVYVWVANLAGLSNVIEGVTGYGLTSLVCPWWPTGIGLGTMFASVGEAIFGAGLVVLLRRTQFRPFLGRRYWLLLIAGAGGGLIYGAWIYVNNASLLRVPGISLANKFRGVLVPATLWVNPLLMPLMWIAVLIWAVLCWRFFVSPRTGVREPSRLRELVVVLSFPAAMSLRSLFGHVLSPYPEVPAMCYPFLLMLAPYLFWQLLYIPQHAGGRGNGSSNLSNRSRSYGSAIIASLTLLYIAIRLGATYSHVLSDQPFRTLETRSGTVRLSGYDVNAAVYKYVLQHTSSSDTLLDLPYGGGINFAAQLPSPIFDTQLTNLPIARRCQDVDLKALQKQPPKVIIAQDEPNYGTYWGIRGNVACPCPRLVWAPDKASWKPGSIFPVVDYIQKHYHVDQKIGDRLLLIPNAEL